MPRPLPAQPLDTPALDTQRPPHTPIPQHNPMQDPYAADFAKVRFRRVPRVRRPRPLSQIRGYGWRGRPHPGGREDGGRAKGGAGLLLALEAVAAVDFQGGWGRGVEADGAALALDFGVGGGWGRLRW